MKNNRYIDIVT